MLCMIFVKHSVDVIALMDIFSKLIIYNLLLHFRQMFSNDDVLEIRENNHLHTAPTHQRSYMTTYIAEL